MQVYKDPVTDDAAGEDGQGWSQGKANKLFSDMTDRYSARSPDWLRWCLCHNKGAAKAAQSKVEAYFQKVNAQSTPGYQSMMFHFYTIINEPRKASLALMTTRDLSRGSVIVAFCCSVERLPADSERCKQTGTSQTRDDRRPLE